MHQTNIRNSGVGAREYTHPVPMIINSGKNLTTILIPTKVVTLNVDLVMCGVHRFKVVTTNQDIKEFQCFQNSIFFLKNQNFVIQIFEIFEKNTNFKKDRFFLLFIVQKITKGSRLVVTALM